ncbi:MAG: nucleotidyltransferase domain-containing protein [Thermoprotei archaeon]
MSSWVEFRFSHLRRWREYAEKVAKAVKDLEPDAEVYVIGGVAEDRITVLSDIDILVVVKRELSPRERRNLMRDVLVRAMDVYGLPFDAPVELHVVGEGSARKYLAKKHIRIVV